MSSNRNSVIGKELHGWAKKVRTDVKQDARTLREHNSDWSVLRDDGNCKIHQECEKNAEFTKLKTFLLNKCDIKILNEDAGQSIDGDRIYCEHENKTSDKSKRNPLVMKGRYAFGVVNRPIMLPNRVISMTERYVPTNLGKEIPSNKTKISLQ